MVNSVQFLDILIIVVYSLILYVTLFYFRSLCIRLLRGNSSKETNSYSVNRPISPRRFYIIVARKHSRNFSTTACLNAKRKRSSDDGEDMEEFDLSNKKAKLDTDNEETLSDNDTPVDTPLDKGKGKEVATETSPTNSDTPSGMRLDKGKGKEIAEPEENNNVDQSKWQDYQEYQEYQDYDYSDTDSNKSNPSDRSEVEEDMENYKKMMEMYAKNVGERIDRREELTPEEQECWENFKSEYSSHYEDSTSNKEFLETIRQWQEDLIQSRHDRRHISDEELYELLKEVNAIGLKYKGSDNTEQSTTQAGPSNTEGMSSQAGPSNDEDIYGASPPRRNNSAEANPSSTKDSSAEDSPSRNSAVGSPTEDIYGASPPRKNSSPGPSDPMDTSAPSDNNSFKSMMNNYDFKSLFSSMDGYFPYLADMPEIPWTPIKILINIVKHPLILPDIIICCFLFKVAIIKLAVILKRIFLYLLNLLKIINKL